MSAAARPRFWDPPTPRVAELIRTAVTQITDSSAEFIAALFEATAEANRELLTLEPRLSDALLAANRGNFAHWVTATLRDPGAPVAAYMGQENIDFARDVVRHGFDETILNGFRAAQNVAVTALQDVAFDVTSDPAELQELLSVVSRSVFAFIDDTLEELHDLIRRERSQLTDATHVARLEVISLIMEGAPISQRTAGDKLRYDLARTHLAGVIWTDDEPQPGRLEAVADSLSRAAGARRPLIVAVSTSSMWIWISGRTAVDIDPLRAALDGSRDVRVALGRQGQGLDGFRAGHLEAVTTQRLVRRLPVAAMLTTYADIEVVALATQDEGRAAEFVSRTLGALATAPVDLRETLRVYLREQCNLTQTASVLFAHRNTVTARLDRARDLLPEGLEGRILPVSLALEIAHVLGPGPRS